MRAAGAARVGAAVMGAFLAVAVSGCGSSGVETTAAAAAKLSYAATAYVAVPEDGRSGTKEYLGSGRDVAGLVAAALSQRFSHVQVAPEPRSARKDLARARSGAFTYLIRPTILRWEDNDSAWLGGADQATILLEITDVASGDTADIAVVEAEPDATSPSSATPAEALEAPLRHYANRLIPEAASAAR